MKQKRSVSVVIALGAIMGCSRTPPPDPCARDTFRDKECQQAISQGGYYGHGTFVPHVYSQPYPYYYGNYGSYVSGGGRVNPAPPAVYAHPSPGGAGVARGGFGSSFFGGGA